MIYAVDVYTGQSILELRFDNVVQVCEYLFETDVTDYSLINIFKYENSSKIPIDFSGVRIDSDCVRAYGQSEGEGHS